MNYWFFIKCFLVGVSVASAVGPIFVLTFNKSALHGFMRGFATALGAAIGDGLLFLLGLVGLLNIIQGSQKIILFLDLAGGLVLIFLGIRMLEGHQPAIKDSRITIGNGPSIFASIARSFVLTIINPLAVIFFMFISLQILPEGVTNLGIAEITWGSLMVASGSLSVLSAIAFIASTIGKSINPRNLSTISFVTGLIFIGIGLYFLGDLIFVLLK